MRLGERSIRQLSLEVHRHRYGIELYIVGTRRLIDCYQTARATEGVIADTADCLIRHIRHVHFDSLLVHGYCNGKTTILAQCNRPAVALCVTVAGGLIHTDGAGYLTQRFTVNFTNRGRGYIAAPLHDIFGKC